MKSAAVPQTSTLRTRSQTRWCVQGPGVETRVGNSGGPMVTLTDGGHYTIIGVTSWGRGCAMETAPGVYARVTHVMDWIQENIKGTLCDG